MFLKNELVVCLRALLLIIPLVLSCSSSDNSGGSSPTANTAGTTVQVSVSATDPDGDQLHYRWAARHERASLWDYGD